jgi:hypothetical protein
MKMSLSEFTVGVMSTWNKSVPLNLQLVNAYLGFLGEKEEFYNASSVDYFPTDDEAKRMRSVLFDLGFIFDDHNNPSLTETKFRLVDEFGDLLYYYVVLVNVVSELLTETELSSHEAKTLEFLTKEWAEVSQVPFYLYKTDGKNVHDHYLHYESSFEAGEYARVGYKPYNPNCAEIVKKIGFHNKKPSDYKEALLSLIVSVSMCFNQALRGIASHFEFMHISSVMRFNSNKLSARYPNGFPTQNVTECCNNRNTKCCNEQDMNVCG